MVIILKRYACERLEDHREIAAKIEDYEKEGWRLHTYQTAGMGAGPMAYKVIHFLLFEKE